MTALAIALCCTPFLVPRQRVQAAEDPPQPQDSAAQAIENKQAGKFTSPDNLFQFDYSGSFLRCEGVKNEAGVISWEPVASCGAYFPMCNNQIGAGEETVACIAYRKAILKDYPEFEAATFSVARINGAATATACTSLPDNWLDDGVQRHLGTVTIHGVSFRELNVGEGGMSQFNDRQIYRTFHRGGCYEVTLRIASISPNMIDLDPQNKPFDRRKRQSVHDDLLRLLNSFRFLN